LQGKERRRWIGDRGPYQLVENTPEIERSEWGVKRKTVGGGKENGEGLAERGKEGLQSK